MIFYDRYAQLCAEKGLDPCARKTAGMFGISRATISSWNTKGTSPKGETVRAIADALHVSADYLLGRIDDPADPTSKPEAPSAPSVYSKLGRLDATDQEKVEAYVDGLLASDKYLLKKQPTGYSAGAAG